MLVLFKAIPLNMLSRKVIYYTGLLASAIIFCNLVYFYCFRCAPAKSGPRMEDAYQMTGIKETTYKLRDNDLKRTWDTNKLTGDYHKLTETAQKLSKTPRKIDMDRSQIVADHAKKMTDSTAHKSDATPHKSSGTTHKLTGGNEKLTVNTTKVLKKTSAVDSKKSLLGDNSCCGQNITYNHCLTKVDRTFYTSCSTHTRERLKGNITKGTCCFMDGSKRAAVGLISHPGSGNTWVRGLLEKATGVCTGSVYCDEELWGSGMRGEGIRSGAVIVTKSHYCKPKWTTLYKPGYLNENNTNVPLYGSAIYILRNPYDAIVAERNREIAERRHKQTHVLVVSKDKFGDNREWNSSVYRQLERWSGYFHDIVGGMTKGHPIHLVRYEDLKSDTYKEVKAMLDFLKFDYEEKDLRARIASNFSTFYRSHHNRTNNLNYYTEDQKLFINESLTETINFLKQTNVTNSLGLEDYLWHSL